jgi:hypothetical protein
MEILTVDPGVGGFPPAATPAGPAGFGGSPILTVDPGFEAGFGGSPPPAATGAAGAPGFLAGRPMRTVSFGFGGRLMRTVSFFGFTLESSPGFGGTPPVGILLSSAIIGCPS